MSNHIELYKQAQAKIIAARKEAESIARSAFIESAAVLFTENPTLKSFDWRQYTPYFNDGDPCEFSAYIDEPGINGVDGDNIYDFGDYNKYQSNVELVPLQKAVRDFLAIFSEDDLEVLFGDGVTVTVRADGSIDVDDYDHD